MPSHHISPDRGCTFLEVSLAAGVASEQRVHCVVSALFTLLHTCEKKIHRTETRQTSQLRSDAGGLHSNVIYLF